MLNCRLPGSRSSSTNSQPLVRQSPACAGSTILGAVLRTYFDVFRDALAKIRAVRGQSYSLDQKCQQMMYYTQWVIQGTETGIDTSGSATIASEKNRLVLGSINDAQPGELVYWSNNHVMRIAGHDDAGRAIGMNTSLKGDAIAGSQLDPFWKLSHVDTYPAKYIGRSARDGHSTEAAPYPIEPWPLKPVDIAPDQRRTRLDVGKVNVRSAPTTTAPIVEQFSAGQIITAAGYVHGERVAQNGLATDLWFVTGHDGDGKANRFAWAGGFTNFTDEGLKQWSDPEPEPEPPVVVPPVEPPTPTPQPDKPEPEPKPSSPALNWITYLIGGVIAAAIGLWAIITGGQP